MTTRVGIYATYISSCTFNAIVCSLLLWCMFEV